MGITYTEVERRLQTLGYEIVEQDRSALIFAIDKVTWTIRNQCNIDKVPQGLKNIAVDMVCGEFLSIKKGSGTLTGFDADNAVKSIKEGDTQVTFAVGDAASPLDWLIDYLVNNAKTELVRYRRFAW